jgi:uncharacterized membrane protein YGL010W
MTARRPDRLLAEYGASHRNAFNRPIHWTAVPAIAWIVIALLRSVPFPFGHAVEGQRPAFLADPRCLLAGPARLMAALYRTQETEY